MDSALAKNGEPTLLDHIEARILEIGGEVRQRGKANTGCPLKHHFTPGLYIREIFMPAGAIITTAIHKTEHPYVVSQGRCLVYLENEERSEVIQAPHFGITKPGTRRLLIVVHDTIWTTFHPTDKTTVEEVEDDILAPHHNPALPDGLYERLRLGEVE